MKRLKNRLVVGLTGIFGSGKSTAAKLLKRKGAFVIDCDALVHEGLRRDAALKRKVAGLFGSAAKDRKLIAKQVFSSVNMRQKLEALIHPYVFRRIDQELKRKKKGIVVIEVPLLFETGFNRKTDINITISARASDVKKRLLRKGFNKSDITRRFLAQLPNTEKCRRADYVAINHGSTIELKEQMDEVWQFLNHELHYKISGQ